MDTNGTKNDTQKNIKFYECKNCDFICYKKGDYTRHLLTQKHNRCKNGTYFTSFTSNDNWVCDCGKIYKYSSGYYRHKKKCYLVNNNEKDEDNILDIKNNTDYKAILFKIIDDSRVAPL